MNRGKTHYFNLFFEIRLDKYDHSWCMYPAITGSRPNVWEITSKHKNMKAVGGRIWVQEQRIQEKLVLWNCEIVLAQYAFSALKPWFHCFWDHKKIIYPRLSFQNKTQRCHHYPETTERLPHGLAVDYTTTIHTSVYYELSIHILLLVNDTGIQLSAHNHQQVKWCCVLALYVNGKLAAWRFPAL